MKLLISYTPFLIGSRMSSTKTPRNCISFTMFNQTQFFLMVKEPIRWWFKPIPVDNFKTISFSSINKLRSMFIYMKRLSTKFQILYSIVQSVSINMMNNFSFLQSSPDMLLNNVGVFMNSSSIRNSNSFISIFSNLSFSISSSFHKRSVT